MRDAFTRILVPMLLLLVLSGCFDTSNSRQLGREQFMKVARPSMGTVISTSPSEIRDGHVYVQKWEMKVPTRHSRTTTYCIPVSELTAADLEELERRNQAAPRGNPTSRPSDELHL